MEGVRNGVVSKEWQKELGMAEGVRNGRMSKEWLKELGMAEACRDAKKALSIHVTNVRSSRLSARYRVSVEASPCWQ